MKNPDEIFKSLIGISYFLSIFTNIWIIAH